MVQVRHLAKRYGPVVAVDGPTFDVLPGRVTGFLGPNGAGKSTTMRLILGLDAPAAGTATVAGWPYRALRMAPVEELCVAGPGAVSSARLRSRASRFASTPKCGGPFGPDYKFCETVLSPVS
jgi:ABC-2 type transport system ATP-binding protein